MSDPNDDESEEEEEDGGVSREVLEAAGRWAAMSAAVAISGGATSDFNREGGFPRQDLIISRAETSEAALNDLLTRCASVAPSLVAEPVAVLPVCRLAAWVPRSDWVNPLETWEGPGEDADAAACLASLRQHLLEKWDTPEMLHGALGIIGDGRSASVPEAAHRASYAFTIALAKAGRGDASVKDALEAALCGEGGGEGGGEGRGADTDVPPVVSKAVAKFLAQPRPEEADKCAASPLHALRRAQVAAQGGEAWVGDGVCLSSMGSRLLGAGGRSGGAPRAADSLPEGVSEPFGTTLIAWVCTHADTLSEPSAVATAVDYALEVRTAQDPAYSLAGRTPKTVAAAMEQFALTSVKFTDD